MRMGGGRQVPLEVTFCTIIWIYSGISLVGYKFDNLTELRFLKTTH